ncbi:MAG: IS110 family transposase [Candidatus Methanoperedens sp.]|nr:MAG: IS110 family transposase [Candidatus Methanoperedens sp.]
MNTTTMLYVGIDISKDKSDICIKDVKGNDLIQRFKITNNKADLGHLYETIERIKSKTAGNSDVVFGMEATGIYSLPLYSALKRDGYKVKLYNPIQTNGFRKMNIRKTKTDPIDSAIIADMLRFSEPPEVNPIKDLNLYQLRELVRIRDRLIDKQTVCKVQLVRNIDTVWPDYSSVMKSATGVTSIAILKKYSVPSKVKAESFEKFYEFVKKKSRSKISRTTSEELYNHAGNVLTIPELDSIISVEIKTLITELELYDEQIQSIEKRIDQMMKLIDSKIMSIPGIGDTLGPMILGEIGDADRFSTAKKLIAFAGLDPVVSQSGRFENKSGSISKRGSPLLRKGLFLAANVARQNDDNLKRFYDKKISEGKHHFSALNAVAAKLLRIVYWVLKNNKEYQKQVN